MSVFRRRVVAVAAKLQPTEGTYSAPSLATDAVRFLGIPTVTIDFQEKGLRDDVQLGVLGIAGRVAPQGRTGAIDLTVEIAGKGSAYTAVTDVTPFDALLQASGFAKSYATGVLTYSDADTGLAMVSLAAYTVDGLLIQFNDAVAKVKFALVAGQQWKATFSIEGNVIVDPVAGTISGLVLPTILPPLWAGTVNTLGTWSTATAAPNQFTPRKVDLDLGNVVTRRPWAGANALRAPVITDRKPHITIETEAVALTTFDPYAQGRAAKLATDTDTLFTAAAGATTGNTFQLLTGAIQLDPPKHQDFGGLAGWSLDGGVLAKSLASSTASVQLVCS